MKRLVPDDRGRITLGKAATGVSSYRASFNSDGTILLAPMKEIPAREAWLWENEHALASVQRGLAPAAPNKPRQALDLSKLPPDDDE